MITILMSGCGGSADSLFSLKFEAFPNSEVHAGKGSKEIAKTASQANIVRTGIKEKLLAMLKI